MGAHLSSISNVDTTALYLLILEFCDWRERCMISTLEKNLTVFCKTSEYYRWLSQILSRHHGIYIPLTLPKHEHWRSIFLEHFPIRNMWVNNINTNLIDNINDIQDLPVRENTKSQSKVNVLVRFRPLSKEETEIDGNNVEDGVHVTLPLHQRLSMIKMSHGLKSNKQALRVLAAEGGWFHNKWEALSVKKNTSVVTTTDSEGGTDKVTPQENLTIDIENRTQSLNGYINPTIGGIKAEKMKAQVQSIDHLNGTVIMVAPDVGLREFAFNTVFPTSYSQSNVYDASTKRLVMDFLNGYNATCIVYGQTGAGKSYTMFGADDSSIHGGKKSIGAGIVPRACAEIISALKQKKEVNKIESRLTVSYIEVFGEYVSDLLKNGVRCGNSKVASQAYVLTGQAEHDVNTIDDVYDALRIGEAQKRRAATAMNERSTRAHAIFILCLHQTCTNGNSTVSKTSKLFLADLGGSEQVKKSQVNAGAQRVTGDEFSAGFELGIHMREAVNINLGLLALKKCIEALNNSSKHVPYHDSKLTMLLSAGLGGNSRTSVVICSRLEAQHAAETVAALRFGERCAKVENTASRASSMLASVLARIDADIKEVERVIVAKERWIDVEEFREDEWALTEIKTEVKKVSKLVGAEAERVVLEGLLQKRAQFAGLSVEDSDGVDIEAAIDSAYSSASNGLGGEGKGKAYSKRSAVIGFGKEFAELYNIGSKYDADEDMQQENSRFVMHVAAQSVPEAVRKRGKKWVVGEEIEEKPEALEAKAMKINRTKLRYAGISLA